VTTSERKWQSARHYSYDSGGHALELFSSGQGSLTGSCQHSSELLGYISGRQFLY
jgi:hypothetical protein